MHGHGQGPSVPGWVALTVLAAHARACASGRWVLNEKRLLADAGLQELHSAFSHAPQEAEKLAAWVEGVARTLTTQNA